MVIPRQNVPYKTKGGPDGAEIRKVKRIVKAFAEEMSNRVRNLMTTGDVLAMPKAPTMDDLLVLRSALVRSVEAGMLERKDQEEIVGLLAALVWFARQKEDKQYQILQHWG
jgi:hypothetical protein